MQVRSIASPLVVEGDRIKGSRFIGAASPVSDEVAARAFIASVAAREPSASHHCWAFVLAGGARPGRGADARLERSDDDGEPGGTAGAPILRRIGGADLQDIVVVVTRYFGGTKLGMGGLVRAYGGCAAAVLDAAEVVVRPVVTRLRFVHPYDLSGPVEGVMSAYSSTVEDATYAADVTMTVTVPAADSAAFVAALAEATAGRVIASPVS